VAYLLVGVLKLVKASFLLGKYPSKLLQHHLEFLVDLIGWVDLHNNLIDLVLVIYSNTHRYI
jgi:hypothetical protein